MIFAFAFAKVKMIQWSPEWLQSYEYSQDDVLDIAVCDSTAYQIMPDGTLQVKGMKYGLQNQESIGFIKTDISSVSRVFCVRGEFWYLTKAGQLMAEDGVESGKLKFKQMFTQHVLDVNGTNDIDLVLTTEGLFIRGDCQDPKCGIASQTFDTFTMVSFSQFTQKITSFHVAESQYNIFLYLENGDVYLTGDTESIPIAQDSDRIRKIGSGIKSVQMGWNATVVQQVLYYLRGTDLMMYSSKLTPNEQLVQTGVIDFLSLEYRLTITESSVELFYENSQKNSGTALYCDRVPTDPLCIKIQTESLTKEDCSPSSTEHVCELQRCRIDSFAEQQMQDKQHKKQVSVDCAYKTPCGTTDYFCWALFCQQYDPSTQVPQCFMKYEKLTAQIQQQPSQQSFFRGNYLFYFEQAPSNTNKVSPGGAAGIAIAVCVVIFTLILTIAIIQLKRKSVSTQIMTQSTDSVITTAQPVEAVLTTTKSVEVL
ncbi:Regulator_of chromosome condensation 1/beta-lactamase-inhibitor protein II [Hexamita inflata]|uniref:Regulator of chromosome condensation 1/beta-lactamase-inhibitor protein II n=1 Tax=Hexamita inflata TaxID=28002 RepID=A0AA86PEL2_9EUKA|nr:Regulator of chromosome condensation 1/beta-lactamase-inhibitor protein II [Hexamita inflata]